MTAEILLSAQEQTLRFGGLVAVDKVSFDVRRGEVFTLIGPNGAGKTTVFNLISRIYTPSSGRIVYDGQDLTTKAPHAVAAREKVEQVIDFLDLQHHRDTMIAGLPYGVRKVVELARALASDPKLLLLDEPSSGLNVEETEDMVYWIDDIRREFGITVLMVEHDMSLAGKVSDRVLAMNQGEVLALGTPEQVRAHPGVIEAYLGAVGDVSSLRRPR
jgi:branched-chain amino acid transport system ATP-binding protein